MTENHSETRISWDWTDWASIHDVRGRVKDYSPPADDWYPRVGERVVVVHSSHPRGDWLCDWMGQELYVAGVEYDLQSKAADKLNITVSEHWPPDGRGDYTDGWQRTDLRPVATQPTAPAPLWRRLLAGWRWRRSSGGGE